MAYEIKNNTDASIPSSSLIKVDLHCHSTFSDGTMSPEAVAANLKLFDVKYAALTDHDTIAGLESFKEELTKHGIGFISGAEITAIHKDYLVHVLAYGFDIENPELQTLMLSKRPAPGDSSSITSRQFHSFSEVIRIIHLSGGIAVLAHPFQTQPDLDKLFVLIEELKALGLDGIEAFYAQNTSQIQLKLYDFAKQRNLIASAGTDYHTSNGLLPGIEIDISVWKEFRDAILKTCVSFGLSQKNPSSPKKPEKERNHWYSFMYNILLPVFLTLSLFIVAFFAVLLPYFENTLMERKRESIRELVQVAWGVLDEATHEVENNDLTLEQAQTLAKNRIEAMRYGSENKDYFWLQDLTPTILMHPYRTDLNGQNVYDFKDTQGNRIFVEFAKIVQEQGEGYLSYVWQWQDDLSRLEPKESYVRLFEPWGWVIGTGIYVHDVHAEIARLRSYLVKVSVGIIGIVFLLLLYLIRQGYLLEKSRAYAQRLLHESIERYSALSEVATEGVLFVFERRCRYANALMYDLLGCNSSGLELLDLDDIFPDIPENTSWRRYLENKKTDDSSKMVSGILQRCDGTQINCFFSVRFDNHIENGLIILVRRTLDNIEHTGAQIALNRLLQLPTNIVSNLSDSIRKADTIGEIIGLSGQVPDLVHSLLENSTSAVTITYMISIINDVLTQRVIELCIAQMGPPPAPYAFLALGSHGRQTQTMFSDQDNALIFKPEKGDNEKASQDYFLELGTRVCDILEQAGYAKCVGGKIAGNPQWCKPLQVWKGYFEEWIINCEPQQVVEFSIFFDFRAVAGDPNLASELHSFITTIIKETPFFLTQVAQNALLYKTPLRLFGTIVTSGEKKNPGRIDVKSPAMAIVSFARLYALKHNIQETNTLLRLDAIRRLGVILDSKHRTLVSVYETLIRLRLWKQAIAREQNHQLDNWVSPVQLGHMEEVVLRECFREIDELQGFIQRDFLV
jgi:CBS domain-containing protein